MKAAHRAAIAFALTTSLFTSGCSSLMARSSAYSEVLSAGTPRDAVIAKLGPPKTTVAIEHDPYLIRDDKTTCTRESFVVRGKIPEENLATNYMNLNLMTLGLSELLLFPIELGRSASASVTEKEVFVHFCKHDGNNVLVGLPFER